ncbi:MAG TPA: radical SAM protein [Acidobacteriota bacterium]|nr:radical SAM protein [Acidobacteriota bacterium]
MSEKSTDRRILLTADRTLMSDYHKNEFLGFGTCAPPNFIPDWLYRLLFFPPIKTNEGVPIAAPYGLRKIEAQLLSEGYDVLTVDPDHLQKYMDDATVLGIHVMDPFGLGPASSTFASVLKKEPFLAQHFRALLSQPKMREAKRKGLKVIVGGPGVWQFHYRPEFVKEYGIDCIIEGEAEKIIGKIFRAALDGETLPQYYETSVKEVPSIEEIPDIVKPSVNGLTELGRGCCRGCEFCSVTLRPLRWFPYEKIMREIDVNIKLGNINWACLHSEDVMLYGSKNIMPNDEKLIKLHELVVKRCEGICWSHCSLAPIASKPKLFSKVAEIIRQKQPWWGAEIGIETGSPELLKKIMPAKTYPFKPEEWPEVVRTSMGLMHDNQLIPACTLIVGVPEETEDDLIKTIELMDDLKGIRSLIVPLFFVPMGKLKDEDWFRETRITKLHKELLIKCLEHGFYWAENLIGLSFAEKWYGGIMRPFYKLFVRIAMQKARKVETV